MGSIPIRVTIFNPHFNMKKLPLIILAIATAMVMYIASNAQTISATSVATNAIGPPRGVAATDMVYIPESTPFVVPVGKTFVLTGVGTQGFSSGQLAPTVVVTASSGEKMATRLFWRNNTSEEPQDLIANPAIIPIGFAVQAGETITVDNTDASGDTVNDAGYAIGYLE